MYQWIRKLIDNAPMKTRNLDVPFCFLFGYFGTQCCSSIKTNLNAIPGSISPHWQQKKPPKSQSGIFRLGNTEILRFQIDPNKHFIVWMSDNKYNTHNLP